MLVNITHDTRGEHNRLLVAGVAYLAVIALLITFSIAIYQKVFTPVTMVTVKADRAGLQLPKFGDVRMHGVLVGQVRSVSQDGHEAVIKLGLTPSAARNIPANVSVEILPTTLFGQKYVQFVDPTTPAEGALHDGTVIPASRVTTSVELETILANLFPLLRSIRPADLNTTLHALATALAGRGEQLGQTMSDLNTYLASFNVHLPTLRTDITELADVAHTYALAAPDLVDLLHNATTTARTVTAKAKELDGFFTDLTSTADTGTRILSDSGDGIIAEAKASAPLAQLLDTYSPEYPCLLKGLDRYTDRLNQIFQHSRVSQTMILSGTQRQAYTSGDRPVYGDVGHGPWCLGLPTPKQGPPIPYRPLKDGSPQDAGPGGAQ